MIYGFDFANADYIGIIFGLIAPAYFSYKIVTTRG